MMGSTEGGAGVGEAPTQAPTGGTPDEDMGFSSGKLYTVIIVISKYRLSLSRLVKPANVRIFIVGPARMVYDETNVDVFYQVEPPMNENDHSQLLQKTRELASIYSATNLRLITFERNLQRAVAKMRYEMDIDGFNHEQIDLLARVRESREITRRGGLSTPRQLTLVTPVHPEQWMEAVRSQLGEFPVFIRPNVLESRSVVGMCRIDGDDEFRHWIRRVCSSPISEWIVEECLEGGHEFVAMATASKGLIYCVSSLDPHRTFFECIRDQRAYVMELLSVDQTRDILPGLESFIIQTLKALFSKAFSGALFIRGYYKGHNEIYLLGVTLEPSSDSIKNLIQLPVLSPGWESIAIESLYYADAVEQDQPSPFHALINFPSSDGILIHQTTIPKRRTSGMRVCWRAAEGQEIKESDGIDGNVVQVFMWNADRQKLLDECDDVVSRVDITIDRNPPERHAGCRRNLGRLNQREFVRSCTTTD